MDAAARDAKFQRDLELRRLRRPDEFVEFVEAVDDDFFDPFATETGDFACFFSRCERSPTSGALFRNFLMRVTILTSERLKQLCGL